MRLPAWLRPLLVLLAAVALTPSAAVAHGKLASAAPAKDARLRAVPTELRLSFTEATELAFTRIELFGPDSQPVALGPVAFADGDAHRVVVAAIHGALAEGSYTVAWQMTGDDGHPVRERYSFMIMPEASGLPAPAAVAPAGPGARAPLPGEAAAAVTAPGQAPLPAAHHAPAALPGSASFDAGSPLYVAVRWLTFMALVAALGAVAFHFLVLGTLRRAREPGWPMHARMSARAALLAAWAAALLGLAAILRLLAQSYALQGAASAFDPAFVATMLGRTTWGWGWMLQAAGAAIAVAGFLAARRGRRAGWAVAALAMAAQVFTPALSGHAVAVPRLAPLAVLADGLHVIGAGGWLGSLLFVVAVGIPVARGLPEGERGRGVADLVNAFSPTALVFAGIVAATGVFSAWLHLGAVSALWQSEYGRALLLKLGVLAVVMATAAYNWLRVRPALGKSDGSARIRRSATAELAIGVVVLLVTAVLVATPPPADATVAGVTATRGPEGTTAPQASRPAIGGRHRAPGVTR